MRLALLLAAALATSACGASIGDPAGAGGGGGGGGENGGGGGGGGGGGLADAGGGNELGPDAASAIGTDAGSTQPSVATAEDFVHGVFGAVCTEAFSCKADYAPSSGDTFAEDWGTSIDNCIDDYDSDYGAGHINSDVTAGKATFDATDASSCLATLTFPTSCTDFFTGNYAFPNTCDTALVGLVADGGACNSEYECGATSDCPSGGGVCTAE